MGPNGAGSIHFLSVIAGKRRLRSNRRRNSFQGENIIEDAPEERAHKEFSFLSNIQ